MRSIRTSWASFMGAGLVFAAAVAHGSEAEELPGRPLYLRYCGACHGPSGKGDGIAGTFMRPKPTDLTQIAKQNNGHFPFRKVVDVIDGRNTPRAHGDPDMPVWGERFHDDPAWDVHRRASVRGKILVITEYLETIQEK